MIIRYQGKALQFRLRKSKKSGGLAEYVYFYDKVSTSRIFHARCEKGVIISFIERMNGHIRRSKTGKTLYIEGNEAEDLFRRLVILAGCRQCIRSENKVAEIAEIVARLGEFETLFWYSKTIERYESHGYLGVCRIARAFRALYGID